MAMRDEDFGAVLTPVEAGDGLWSPPMAAPARGPCDWRSLYDEAHAHAETERARAEAAEARVEELLQAERVARSRAGSLKWQLDRSRTRLKAAVEETAEVRRTAKDALFHQTEVARLEKLLAEAGVDSRKGANGRLRRENARLHKALERAQGQKDEIASLRGDISALRKSERAAQASLSRESAKLRKTLERANRQQDTIEALRTELREAHKATARLDKEIAWLGVEVTELGEEASASTALADAIEALRAENAALHKTARAAESRCKWLDAENADLRWAQRNSHEREDRLKNRHRDEIDRLNGDIARERSFRARSWQARQAIVEPLTRRLAQLRKATGRAKDVIESLRRRNAELRAETRELKAERTALASRVETLEAQVEKLRSTRRVLSKALFGSRSEKRKKAGTGRKRGQQPGAPGHGRTRRPGLGEKKERHNPPKDARTCSCCGKPYVANGERSTSLIEIEVKAHIRRIERPRWRRGCECASSPLEVTAPPVPRLFPGTLYGTSFWARFLFEHCACRRPLSRVAAWYADQGLPVSPGTLANSLKRFVPLFDPIHEAILAHQNRTTVRHADETGWRVQEFRDSGRSSRAWLWTSVSADAVYFHIDPSRSAEVAKTLFGDTACTVFVVCDRYSAYRKLARELDGKVILCLCWAHQRRDFIECAAGHARLSRWCEGWIERIGEIYRLNDERLKHYDPARALERQTPAFDAAQDELKKAVERLFADAGAELAGLPQKARKAKALRSLLNHREGLCVFVDHPQVPMDNNAGERALRGPVIGRRLSFGSNSEDGAKFTAIMYSVVGTLSMNGIDVLRWLEAWLDACAENGGKPPDDLSPWLPWTMSEKRRREFMTPE